VALEERRRAGARILDLTESNPTRAGLAYPPDLVRAFEDPRVLLYEPAPAGALDAREAVAAYYAQRGIAVEPSRILLTASTSEAYAYLFKLLTDPGDDVLVPRPSYPLFGYLADMESIGVRQYGLSYHSGWSIDVEGIKGALSDRTRAVAVVNPNNPTGSYVKRGELEALGRLCAERGIPIVSDEVFSDYAFAPDA
jgi:aspartate/methionine/tyrosine aminotransferase